MFVAVILMPLFTSFIHWWCAR